MLRLRVIGLEVVAADVLLNLLLPGFLAVGKQPLELKSDNTVIARTRHNFAFRLVVDDRLVRVNQVLLDKGLCFFDFAASELSNLHDSFVEALLVCGGFCLGKLISILVRLDLELLAKGWSTKITELWNIDDRHGVERHNPLF